MWNEAKKKYNQPDNTLVKSQMSVAGKPQPSKAIKKVFVCAFIITQTSCNNVLR